MKKIQTLILIISCLFIVNLTIVNAAEVNHKFTYQGQLMNGVAPANGDYDIIIQAYTTEFGNTTWGDPSVHSVVVDNGVFTIVDVDLGDDASLLNYELNGLDLFLEIQVRQAGGNPVYEVLSPRQKLTAVPYAKKLVNGRASSGQVYTFDGFEWLPADNNHTSYSAGVGISISGTTISNNITSLDDLTNASTSNGFNSLAVGTTLSGSTGSYNSAIGIASLNANTTGAQNTAIGTSALQSNIGGSFNTAIGNNSLRSNTSGNSNTVVGEGALQTTNGSNNTVIGYKAGESSTGSGNVFIGNSAGTGELGDNKLYIENSGSSLPLIGGDFATNEVVINGKLGIGTDAPDETMHIKGTLHKKIKVESTSGNGSSSIKLQTNAAIYDYLSIEKHGPDSGSFSGGIPLAQVSRVSAGANAGPLMLQVINPSPMYFLTNNVLRMTLMDNGNLELEKKLIAPDSGTADMKAYIYGSTSSNSGALNVDRSSNGFTVVRQSAGIYRVVFDVSPGNVYVANVDVIGSTPKFVTISRSASYFDVYIWNLSSSNVDAVFNFVVFKKS